MMSPLVFFLWYGLAARSTMTAHPMNSGYLVLFSCGTGLQPVIHGHGIGGGGVVGVVKC